MGMDWIGWGRNYATNRAARWFHGKTMGKVARGNGFTSGMNVATTSTRITMLGLTTEALQRGLLYGDEGMIG